jgi:inosine/xanthosine triphosphate pyrophosphatase family protein
VDDIFIAIAGANPAKAASLLHIASVLGVRCARRVAVDVDEDGPTFADNARAKAVAASRAPGIAFALASDGGIEIPALGPGWDPLRTSRFAGRADPREKARRLLARLEGLTGDARRARWTEALAIARDGEALAVWTERGPERTIGDRLPATVGPFWVDALLGPADDPRDHWAKLRERLAAFWTSAEVTR